MRDGRLPPFCYQTVAATRALRQRFTGKERTAALAVYQAMTELANIRGGARARGGFEASRAEVAHFAGVGKRTVDRYAAIFEQIGLLEIERQSDRYGQCHPNMWCLLEPGGGGAANNTGGGAAAAPLKEEELQKKKGTRAAGGKRSRGDLHHKLIGDD